MKYSFGLTFIDIAISLLLVVCLFFLFSHGIRKSKVWNATVTPLASIIGSGFLVVAPLLWILAGYASIWVLLCVVLAAYAMGSVIRYNIQFVEPFLYKEEKDYNFTVLNDISYITLGVSYFISIAFYIRILSSFALKTFFVEEDFLAKVTTSLILLFIGLVGFFRGFNRLESLEVYSVNIKISIICMFLLGLFLYDWIFLDFHYIGVPKEINFSILTIRKVFGILLIVQGFEISRYIGHKYSGELRIKTMKLAQIISSLIYLVFVFLIMFLMGADQKVTDTAIIDVSKRVSLLLPLSITIGAIFSQFSAAIADTVGCGGIITEYSGNRVSRNTAYLFITIGSTLLIWFANVFEIITLASRTFALYYFTQCLQALYANHVYKVKWTLWSFYFMAVGILMFLIFIFGVPSG
jgi:hypothetical protein